MPFASQSYSAKLVNLIMLAKLVGAKPASQTCKAFITTAGDDDSEIRAWELVDAEGMMLSYISRYNPSGIIR